MIALALVAGSVFIAAIGWGAVAVAIFVDSHVIARLMRGDE